MYLVEDKGGAIALMLVSLFFLGTWPAIMNFLERKGRLPQHTYLDYCITNYLAAILIAFTLGQIGSSTPETPNFLTQLKQDNGPSVAFAMAGGVVLCLGNLSLQYALAFVGLSVAEVISCSLTVVAGTTMNYFLDARINRAEILFPGVACFLVAVFLGSALHASNMADNNAKLEKAQIGDSHKDNFTDGSSNLDNLESAAKTIGNSFDIDKKLDGDKLTSSEGKPIGGTAEFLKQLEKRRAIKDTASSTILGLFIIFFAGGCFSLFSPAFNVATNDQWHTLKPGVPHLVVYTAFFYFSTSFFVLAVFLNIFFLYKPILGLPKSSFSKYAADWKGRPWALLAGLLCGLGNGLQFMGGQAAGYAAADAVQAMPLVSTVWGVLIFREYYRSSRKTYVLLASMLLMFVVAVAVLMASSGKRKTH
ncbi:hypothetical protein O6H91_03G046900 [Diphasiastrum complanatum]|uniref:Uncharacterized protein n=7 Tax=Diphasiastrum complanatum TaxID=34168 RepID=A0ACC2E524_DIPCM|nr:hypothetical protein O6H91_03G032500 [Diphasiastrum complanatum]KAJ7561544.1 hypothetical protein O6H91_03G032500 [Diphasiastrum complanatum]KAJ7561545.1 hypothetical protein O6H91_03G032500 [Diphasiastrum complanatum]KAJ7561546.1 hypothetical protein O6H91_03G032500 [Diphasiastrum complanatum]KAJ7561903.1 hypothetical protein O6H91_03G046900 [Diphasiastrum complanatum]